jgi:hypothetical protein
LAEAIAEMRQCDESGLTDGLSLTPSTSEPLCAAPLVLSVQAAFGRPGKESKSSVTAKAALVNRFWLQHYPDGVPADVDVSQYSLLVELFEESFARFEDSKAAICMDKAITYGEHRQVVMRHRSAKQRSREKGPHCGQTCRLSLILASCCASSRSRLLEVDICRRLS